MRINIKEEIKALLEFTSVQQKNLLVPKDKKDKPKPAHITHPQNFGSYVKAKNDSLFAGPNITKNNANNFSKQRVAAIRAEEQ